MDRALSHFSDPWLPSPGVSAMCIPCRVMGMMSSEPLQTETCACPALTVFRKVERAVS